MQDIYLVVHSRIRKKNKARKANKVQHVDCQTNALPDRPTDQPNDQRTQPVVEGLCRTSKAECFQERRERESEIVKKYILFSLSLFHYITWGF